jgi:hypothetical protein
MMSWRHDAWEYAPLWGTALMGFLFAWDVWREIGPAGILRQLTDVDGLKFLWIAACFGFATMLRSRAKYSMFDQGIAATTGAKSRIVFIPWKDLDHWTEAHGYMFLYHRVNRIIPASGFPLPPGRVADELRARLTAAGIRRHEAPHPAAWLVRALMILIGAAFTFGGVAVHRATHFNRGIIFSLAFFVASGVIITYCRISGSGKIAKLPAATVLQYTDDLPALP